ncbi:MAG TPA: hypothetical protein VMU29_02630 [Smithella sp.]|nr:hypothetical protein [Smithella sp.]
MKKISLRKIGIILIITGIFLHVISIPYLTGYNHHVGYLASIPYMKILIPVEKTIIEAPPVSNKLLSNSTTIQPTNILSGQDLREIGQKMNRELFPEASKPVKTIAYKDIILLTTSLIFIGTIMIVVARRKIP